MDIVREFILMLALSQIIFFGRDLKASENSSFSVIVNAQNPVDSLDRKFLSDIFFKKITHWPEDGVVQPVDLKQDAPARSKFSEEVLNRSVIGVKNYWQQLIFSGRDVPPPELKTDDEVIQYVLKNTGSIGYVSSASISAVTSQKGIKRVNIK